MINPSDILHGKILIVDDQPANIALLERMLRGADYNSVTSTMNPHEVPALHSENRYDLILLDLVMPSAAFSGFQVIEALKEIETGGYVPVVVISAHTDHKLHALQAGAMDFIDRPFELTEVLTRVRNLLHIRLLQKQMKDRIVALERKLGEVEASRDLLLRQNAGVHRE